MIRGVLFALLAACVLSKEPAARASRKMQVATLQQMADAASDEAEQITRPLVRREPSIELADAIRFVYVACGHASVCALLSAAGDMYAAAVGQRDTMAADVFYGLHRDRPDMLEAYSLMSGPAGEMELSEYHTLALCFHAFSLYANNGAIDVAAWNQMATSAGISAASWAFTDVASDGRICAVQFAVFFKFLAMGGGLRDISPEVWSIRHPGSGPQNFEGLAGGARVLTWTRWRGMHPEGLGTLAMLSLLGAAYDVDAEGAIVCADRAQLAVRDPMAQ